MMMCHNGASERLSRGTRVEYISREKYPVRPGAVQLMKYSNARYSLGVTFENSDKAIGLDAEVELLLGMMS
jgi:hypothetical protein